MHLHNAVALRASGLTHFNFYAGDGDEPAHVHVGRERSEAKFWLDPPRLSRSRGFATWEIRRISDLVEEHHRLLLESWHEFFHR